MSVAVLACLFLRLGKRVGRDLWAREASREAADRPPLPPFSREVHALWAVGAGIFALGVGLRRRGALAAPESRLIGSICLMAAVGALIVGDRAPIRSGCQAERSSARGVAGDRRGGRGDRVVSATRTASMERGYRLPLGETRRCFGAGYGPRSGGRSPARGRSDLRVGGGSRLWRGLVLLLVLILWRPEVMLLAVAAFPWVDWVARRSLGGLGAAWDDAFLLLFLLLLLGCLIARRWELLWTVPITLPVMLGLVAAVGSVVVRHVPSDVGALL